MIGSGYKSLSAGEVEELKETRERALKMVSDLQSELQEKESCVPEGTAEATPSPS